MYNWSDQPTGVYGGRFTGHSKQSLDSHTGHNNYYNYHTFNREEYHDGYTYTGQSYNQPKYINVQHNPSGQWWNSSNHTTGQSTSYSCYGLAVPPGYIRQHQPPYGGHKKVLYGNDFLGYFSEIYYSEG